MADEPKKVDWKELAEPPKVAEKLGLCPADNGEALVTSAFQLTWPDLASHGILNSVDIRKNFVIDKTYAMVGTSVRLVPTKAELTLAKSDGWQYPPQLRKAALYAGHSRAPGRPSSASARQLSARKWKAMSTWGKD